jgi:hypothetical protein
LQDAAYRWLDPGEVDGLITPFMVMGRAVCDFIAGSFRR